METQISGYAGVLEQTLQAIKAALAELRSSDPVPQTDWLPPAVLVPMLQRGEIAARAVFVENQTAYAKCLGEPLTAKLLALIRAYDFDTAAQLLQGELKPERG